MSCSRNIRRRQTGQGMSEYIIITALVAVAGIGVFAAFGDVLQSQTSAMSKEMAGQSGGEQIDAAQTNADSAVKRASNATNLETYDQQNAH